MTDHPPPILHHRETVFTGRVFRVEREAITLPNGVDTTIDIVRHRGSVVLVPMTAPDTIVLIRQYRHVIGRWIWEVPAGTLEAGEAPELAARRECEEEIGLTPGRVTRLGAYYPTPGFCDELMVFYRLEDLAPLIEPVAHDADEQIEPREFALAEARRLIERGEICDLKTALALALV
jgi:ADP-ribose pyrophosphatase